MIKIEYKIIGHNFSRQEDGGIIYEVLPRGEYRLFQNYHIDTGIKIKTAIKTEFIELMTTGRLHLKKGLLSDGITFFPDFERGLRSSWIHDPLCGLIIRGYLNEKHLPAVNDLFKKTCIQDKVNKYLAKTLRFFLRLGSKAHIKNMIEKEDNVRDVKLYEKEK